MHRKRSAKKSRIGTRDRQLEFEFEATEKAAGLMSELSVAREVLKGAHYQERQEWRDEVSRLETELYRMIEKTSREDIGGVLWERFGELQYKKSLLEERLHRIGRPTSKKKAAAIAALGRNIVRIEARLADIQSTAREFGVTIAPPKEVIRELEALKRRFGERRRGG